MVSYARICGVAPLMATTVFSAAGIGSLAGRIGFALIADRVGAKPGLVVGLAIQALAILLYTVAHDLPSLYALSALFGFSYGGVMPLYAILVRQYFGARIMGATFGAAVVASTVGMAIGPVVGAGSSITSEPTTGCTSARSRWGLVLLRSRSRSGRRGYRRRAR